jgi:hypothetical protein
MLRVLSSLNASCGTGCCAETVKGASTAATAALGAIVALDRRLRVAEAALLLRDGADGTLGSGTGGGGAGGALLSSQAGSIRSYPSALTQKGEVFCARGTQNYEVPCSAPIAKYLFYPINGVNTPSIIRQMFEAESKRAEPVIVENEDYFELDGETYFRVLGDYRRIPSNIYLYDTLQQYTMVVDKPVYQAYYVSPTASTPPDDSWLSYGYLDFCQVDPEEPTADLPDPDTLG